MFVMEPPPGSETPAEATAVVSRIPAVTFASLTFSDGTTVTLDPRDIVVFVGPNNAGKSVALRELEQYLVTARPAKVISGVELLKEGDVDDLRAFLEKHGQQKGDRYEGFRFNVRRHDLANQWGANVGPLKSLFCTRLPTETRIIDSNQQALVPLLDQPPQHPIHILYGDENIAQRIGSYFRRAFGEDLVVFYLGGSQVPLLTGRAPTPKPGEDRVSHGFNQRLRASTIPLDQQGDGMRSFATVILHMLAPGTQSILLLDEPEAFLHPPQARLLGEFIATEGPTHAQLFVATHSADVLQGLLNVASEHLRVLRIQRVGSVNRVKELDKMRAKAIGGDPLMKFTSVMSGVFHSRVIVCEADADCMLFSAILDLPTVRGEQHPDVLFVQTGGKSRMSAVVEALRALDVIVDVVVDIDILREEAILERVVTALGGEWSSVETHARSLKTAIEHHKPWLTAGEVAKGIQEIVSRAPTDGEFPKKLRSEINALFKKASPWDVIKDAGRAGIPAGEATIHYRELERLCRAVGLWIIPVGELEGFCKSEGGHGPTWVQNVLERHDLANDVELEQARDFVRRVWTSRPSVNVTAGDTHDAGVG